ncbi:Gfo/Idh/MocA family protein [Pseudomonas sp. NPDC087615]|uniref:Gfo/Idh/MocA family protein n=1 Tax=Pseudomonas sp. NPDC087615 TaxID=3364443 RepID=UPI0037FF6F70
MESRGFNFALVGCGRISAKHVQALSSVDLAGSRVVAVCDVKYERAQALGARLGVPAYGCAHEMMQAHPEVDVMSILSESGLHAEHCLDLIRYRKHMVVEKPMALTVDDADAMIRACDEAKVKLFIVKQNRYNNAVRLLLSAIEEQRFGRIFMVTARVRWARHAEYYEQDSWRGSYRYDGGVFANQACHYVDLIQLIMGVPDQVFAKGLTVSAPIEAEDTGIAIFSKGTVIGTLEATTAARPENLEGSLTVLGEFGAVELAGVALNEVKTWKFQTPYNSDAEALQHSGQIVDSVYGFGHIAYLADVVNALRTGGSAAVEGLEGRKTVEILSAIYESLASGKEVNVADTYSNSRLGLRQSSSTRARESEASGLSYVYE